MMAHRFKLTTGDGLIERLTAAGVLPNNCRRFIIDVEVDEVPVIYFECFGDERLITALEDPALLVTEPAEGREA